LTAGDRHIVGRSRNTEPIGAFQTDRVIIRRINTAIRHSDISAAVNIKAVAIRVHFDVAESQVVHAGGKQHEPASLIDREIPQDDIPATLERDCLVALARSRAAIAKQSASPNPAWAKD